MNHQPAYQPLSLGKYQKVPLILTVGGGLLALVGFFVNRQQFAFSWLTAFMFFLSLALGALFLVMMHHLFDAAWSVPIRRVLEHLGVLLFPTLALLFIPIACLAPSVYPWMHLDPHFDHALEAKQPLFTMTGFYLTSAFCFLVWWWLSRGLRGWSLRQDQTGAAEPTFKMRFYSCVGIVLFAITLTLGSVMWMKALMQEWFSTMYGVWYFSGSVWLALATVYVITRALDRQKILSEILHQHQYYYIGSLLFAFTVFYAYITFSQYFIIWNANMPEETFWYLRREVGTWFYVSMVIIFGHFFIPFLGPACASIEVRAPGGDGTAYGCLGLARVLHVDACLTSCRCCTRRVMFTGSTVARFAFMTTVTIAFSRNFARAPALSDQRSTLERGAGFLLS